MENANTFSLELYMTGVVLAEAGKTWTADGRRMRPPGRCCDLAEPIRTRADTAVKDRDQMCVGKVIEYVAAPRPIHACEQQVAID